MYIPPKSNYPRRTSLVHKNTKLPPKFVVSVSHEQRVMKELRNLGVSKLGMGTMESRYLPQIIHPDEHIGGVVYGHHKDGFAMLVATNLRVIYLDKKLFFVNEDELTYRVVSGVNFSHAGLGSTVVLHTRIRDFRIRTLNQKCALAFVEYIESRTLEHGTTELGPYD